MNCYRLLAFQLLVAICCLLPVALPAQTYAVSDVDAFSFGSWAGSGDPSDNDDLCMYVSDGSNYQVRVTGSSAAGSGFQLSDVGGTHTITYTVEFKNSRTTSGSYDALTHNVNSSSYNNSTTVASCSNNQNNMNANWRVNISATTSGIASVPSGDYTGTLTVVVGLPP